MLLWQRNIEQLMLKRILKIPFGLLLVNDKLIKNQEKAVQCFKKLSEQHSVKGKFWFGLCLVEGRRVQKSFYRGLELIHQSFDMKYFPAKLLYPVIEPAIKKFT
jgi:hypothetical protein